MKKFLIILFILLSGALTSLAEDIKPSVLEHTRKAIVTINSRISVSAYRNTGNTAGTGFIVDKKMGLIITNAHVATSGSIASHFITFYD
ncbi:MAG: hypothetical protein RLZZ59_455, partial [Pseudomonadota bacterium]